MLRHAVVAECRKLKGSCIWLAFLFYLHSASLWEARIFP